MGLDSGRVGDYLWEVKAKRQAGGGGQAGAQRPCLHGRHDVGTGALQLPAQPVPGLRRRQPGT